MKLTLQIAKSIIRKLTKYQGKYYLIEDINNIFFPKKTVNKTKAPKVIKEDLQAICDGLWSECVKLRAGYKSEISGKEGKQIGGSFVIAAHHIGGKKTRYMRYLLENGICLEATGEHIFGIHSRNIITANQFKQRIELVKGKDIYEKLASYSNHKSKSLKEIRIYLENELARLKRG